ncbi:MAG: adenylyl-sulfate kinase [bacterium]
MVIWIIGLAGAGKTTIGRELFALLRKSEPNTVFVDGDEIRSIFKHDHDKNAYTLKGRRKNAERIGEICAWLDRQGINVICSILSVFEETRTWNRKTYSSYFEVFIDVSMDILKKRDKKGLYSGATAGKIENVVGFDIPFERPEQPDIVVNNDSEINNFQSIASNILEAYAHREKAAKNKIK